MCHEDPMLISSYKSIVLMLNALQSDEIKHDTQNILVKLSHTDAQPQQHCTVSVGMIYNLQLINS